MISRVEVRAKVRARARARVGVGLGLTCAVLSGVMMFCDSAAVDEKFSRMTW